MIRGIDVSNHQGDIGWPSVATDGIQFAIIKASEGTDFVDRFFPDNWAGAKAAGLVRGAYHYARVGNTPQADADHFLSVVTPQGIEPGDLVVLDLEEGTGNLANWALVWLAVVEKAVGFKPLLYSYPHFMAQHGLNSNAALTEYGLWYASYGANNVPQGPEAIPAAPGQWPVIAIWQDTSNGHVAGINGVVDLNWFNGDTLDQLRAYGKPGDVATNPYWDQVGAGLAAAIRQRGDEPVGPERYVHDPDRPGQNITSHVDGRQRTYTWHHDAQRPSVKSYEPLTPPG